MASEQKPPQSNLTGRNCSNSVRNDIRACVGDTTICRECSVKFSCRVGRGSCQSSQRQEAPQVPCPCTQDVYSCWCRDLCQLDEADKVSRRKAQRKGYSHPIAAVPVCKVYLRWFLLACHVQCSAGSVLFPTAQSRSHQETPLATTETLKHIYACVYIYTYIYIYGLYIYIHITIIRENVNTTELQLRRGSYLSSISLDDRDSSSSAPAEVPKPRNVSPPALFLWKHSCVMFYKIRDSKIGCATFSCNQANGECLSGYQKRPRTQSTIF